ncbi:MAG: hypothetical protein U1F47_09765 [Hyphomicrobiales bacterium]
MPSTTSWCRAAARLTLLRDMYKRSRGFRLAVDEVEKSLYLADMTVAEQYAALVEDRFRLNGSSRSSATSISAPAGPSWN